MSTVFNELTCGEINNEQALEAMILNEDFCSREFTMQLKMVSVPGDQSFLDPVKNVKLGYYFRSSPVGTHRLQLIILALITRNY